MQNNTKRITICALLIALGVLLSRLISIDVPLGGSYAFNIGFGMLPILLICVLYGPVYGGLGALLWDLVGAIIFPKGAFVVWFTLAAGVFGFVTGAFFSKIIREDVNTDEYGCGTRLTVYHSARLATTKRVIAAIACGQILYSIVLNTLILTLLYGIPLKALLIPRIAENAVMIFVNALLVKLLLQALSRTGIITDRLPSDKSVAEASNALTCKSKTYELKKPSSQTGEQATDKNDLPYMKRPSDGIGIVGGYICNKNYEKAKTVYDMLMQEYRNNRDIFTEAQKQELSEYRAVLMEHLPQETFIVIEDVFDADCELSELSQLIADGDSDAAEDKMKSILTYFLNNRSMFTNDQKTILRNCRQELSKLKSEATELSL